VFPGIKKVIPDITVLTPKVDDDIPETVLLSIKVQPVAGKVVAGVPPREVLL
jgi:hypothetical protein